MHRPIATTVLAIALLAAEGSPVTPPSSGTTPPPEVVVSPAPANPQQYQQYRDSTGYPYDPGQYHELPGHQRCGTACGQEPTTGEQQLRYLCDHDLVDRARC